VKTSVQEDSSRTVISRNESPDIPFEQSVNPYRGCEHGCIYCFARPSHAYLGMSPGLDFETKILAKPRVAELLQREFRKPRYECKVLAMSGNTDPYQPVERKLELARSILEVCIEFQHPVVIVTKSSGVLRDLDLLKALAAKNLVRALISITSLNARLSRCMEPRAASPRARVKIIETLATQGIPTGVLLSPVIPGLNDSEIEVILETVSGAGADHARYLLLRLPLELKELFGEWLEEHYPERASRIISLIRQVRGGDLYESEFGTRMRGRGPIADLIYSRFATKARTCGVGDSPIPLSLEHFAVPDQGQLKLFE